MKIISDERSHLVKRIIRTELGSPYTQVKPGSNLLIIGGNWGFSGNQNCDLTLDGQPFLTFSDLYFNNGVFEVNVYVPVATSPGTHQWCAITASRQACFNIVVCPDCGPSLGFVDGFNISSSTTSVFPYWNLNLVGDAFKRGEDLTVYLDRAGSNMVVLGTGFITQPNGRFGVSLPLPKNVTYGSHTVSVLGSNLPFGEYPDFVSATFNVVRFMPD